MLDFFCLLFYCAITTCAVAILLGRKLMHIKKELGEEHCLEQCSHGKCLGHTSSWEDLGEGRFEPRINFLGIIKKSWAFRCCDKWMIRGMRIQKMRCIKCNATREYIKEEFLCQCCGLSHRARI